MYGDFRNTVCKPLHLEFVEKTLKQKPFQVIWDKKEVYIQLFSQLTSKQFIDFTVVKYRNFEWQPPKTRILMFEGFKAKSGSFIKIDIDCDTAWKLFNKSLDSWIIPIKINYWEIEKFLSDNYQRRFSDWRLEKIPIHDVVNNWIDSLESPPDHE